MAHKSDGLEMTFTHRGSWKANIWHKGKVIDTVPVSWTKGWVVKKGTKEIFLEVWFKDRGELEKIAHDPTPFNVAVGVAHDYDEMPHSFAEYRGLFKVVPTGEVLSDISIETKVIERVRGD